MTSRRIPLLHSPKTAARSLCALVSAIDDAAGLYRQQWQRGFIPCLQPVRIAYVPRANSRVK